MTSSGEEGKGTDRAQSEFSESLWKAATWGSSTPSRRTAQLEKRLLTGKRQYCWKASPGIPTTQEGGSAREDPNFLCRSDGVCTLTSLLPSESKALSVWNTFLPASPFLLPSPGPGTLGYRLTSHLSALSLGVSSCGKGKPCLTTPSLSSLAALRATCACLASEEQSDGQTTGMAPRVEASCCSLALFEPVSPYGKWGGGG